MSTIEAWKWIFSNWSSPDWKQIPIEIQKALNLDSRLGICHCSLVTKTGANGINSSIHWLNRVRA